MPQPEERSAPVADQSGRSTERFGPLLVPIRLEPGADPLDGFSPEASGADSDPLDSFKPESARRFYDLSELSALIADPVSTGSEDAHQTSTPASPEPAGRPPQSWLLPAAAAVFALAIVLIAVFVYTGAPRRGSTGDLAGAAADARTELRNDHPPVSEERAAAPSTGAAPAAVAASATAVTAAQEEPSVQASPPTPEAIRPSQTDVAAVSSSTGSVDRVAGPVAAAGNRGAAPPPARGQLEIASDPVGARVFLDGRPAGITPLTVRAVLPAVHAITVSKGSTVANRRVDVAAGKTASVFVSLADPSAAQDSGSFVVRSPLPLRIVEEGRTLGLSGEAVVVAAGRHRFELVNDEIELRVPVIVEIVAAKPTHLSVPMPTGTISLNATPWAEVFIDGRSVGVTPIANAQVSVGRHDVAWRHPQLGEKHSTVVVGARTTARASMDLKQ